MGKTVWIHVIHMKLVQPANARINPKGRRTIDPEDCTWTFGIMGTAKMPSVSCDGPIKTYQKYHIFTPFQLPKFPVYTRQGELSVRVYSQQQLTVSTIEEIEVLAHFHQYLFSEILRLEKFSMIFALDRAPCSCFVVPLRKGTKLAFYPAVM